MQSWHDICCDVLSVCHTDVVHQRKEFTFKQLAPFDCSLGTLVCGQPLEDHPRVGTE